MSDKKISVVYDDAPPPPKAKGLWEGLNTPIADLRSSNPTTKKATDEFAKTHPILGGAANALIDTASAMSSPLSLGLGAATGGASLLEKAGLGGVLPFLHTAAKAGAVGMVGHGSYKAYTGATPYDKAGGLAEAALGGLGLMAGPKGAAPTGPDYTTPSGLRVAVDTLKNYTGPVTPDILKMHEALDAHTLQSRKGAIAINDIYGKEGRPDTPVKDDKGQFNIVSKGLPIVDAERAYQQGLTEAGKDVKNSNALERAKGAPSKIEQSELQAKKPLLDLIEASKSRNLTSDELSKVGTEIKSYPKGVVAKSLLDLKKTAADVTKTSGQAAKMNASDAAANLDVKMNQAAKLDEDAKLAANATKPLDKAKAKADEAANKNLSKGNTPENRDAQNLIDTQKWADKQQADKIAQSNAEAQQNQFDNFIGRDDVKAGPQSASVGSKGQGPNGESQSLRQSYNVVPPKPTPKDSVTPAEGTPSDKGSIYKKGMSKDDAIKAADAAGGPGIMDVIKGPASETGDHYLVPAGKGPVIDPLAPTPPAPAQPPLGSPWDVAANRRYGNKAEAATIAKVVGGQVYQHGPRQYSIRMPEVAPEAPYVPRDLAAPTPDQQWAAGGDNPSKGKYSSLGPNTPEDIFNESNPGPEPEGADTSFDPEAIEASQQKPLEVAPDFRQHNLPRKAAPAGTTLENLGVAGAPDPLTPKVPGFRVANGIANADAFKQGPAFTDPNAIETGRALERRLQTGEAPQGIPERRMAPPVSSPGQELTNVTPDGIQHIPTEPEAQAPEVPPQINATGEAEPTLPGVVPTVNPDAAPVAEAPYGLTPQAPQAPTQTSGNLFGTPETFDQGTARLRANPPAPSTNRGLKATLPGFDESVASTIDKGKSMETLPQLSSSDIVNNAYKTELNKPENQARIQKMKADMEQQVAATRARISAESRPNEEGPFSTITDNPSEAAAQPPKGGAAPIRFFKSPLEAAGQGYGDIKAAKAAGEVVPEQGRKIAGQAAQRLNREAQAAPQAPSAPQMDPDAVAQAKSLQAEIDSPDTDPLTKAMLKKHLSDFADKYGIKFFPGDEGGGTTLSMFGAGQGRNLSRAFQGLQGTGEEDALTRAGGFLNNLRRSTLLSPYSVAKKGIGDIQALGTAAMTRPSQAGEIGRNLFSPDTIENFKSGWNSPTQGLEDDSMMGKSLQSPNNPLSWAGRTMAGMTNATKNVLTNSGFTPEEAQGFTLTKTPSRMFTAPIYETLNKPGFNHLDPFSRIGLNWIEQGYEHSPAGLADLYFKKGNLSPEEASMIKRKAAIGTAVGAGAYAATPDDFVKNHPMAARMMTAGPLGPAALMGMLLKNQTKDDSLPVGQALGGLLNEMPGMQLADDLHSIKTAGPKGYARNYLASYSNVTRPIAEALDPAERDTSSKDLSPTESLLNKAEANVPILRGTLPLKVDKKPSIKVVY